MNTNMTLEKRILSVLLTVIMVFSMLPIQVLGAGRRRGDRHYIWRRGRL